MCSSKENISIDSDCGGLTSTVRSAPPCLLSPAAAAASHAAKRKPGIPLFGNNNFSRGAASSVTSSRYSTSRSLNWDDFVS